MLNYVPVVIQMGAEEIRHYFYDEGKETLEHLTNDEIMVVMSQLYLDLECIHLADYNFYFGHERDTVAEMLGYYSWEDLMEHREHAR